MIVRRANMEANVFNAMSTTSASTLTQINLLLLAVCYSMIVTRVGAFLIIFGTW
jgi:hypothetical protein